mgnify:CR=1 FL=1
MWRFCLGGAWHSATQKTSKKHPVTIERGAVLKRIQEAQATRSREKSLVTQPERSQKRRPIRNRAVLMVRGPHWLHAFWEITTHSVQRVKAAMGAEWHAASDRLLPLVMIPYLGGIETTVAEVERSYKNGLKTGIMMLSEPSHNNKALKHFNDPYWNPLWSVPT